MDFFVLIISLGGYEGYSMEEKDDGIGGGTFRRGWHFDSKGF